MKTSGNIQMPSFFSGGYKVSGMEIDYRPDEITIRKTKPNGETAEVIHIRPCELADLVSALAWIKGPLG